MRQRGFTIIELAIVMAVMAILLTLGTLGFRSYMAHARDKEREADILAIQNYLESIYPREIRDASGTVIKPAGTYPGHYAGDSLSVMSASWFDAIFHDMQSSSKKGPLDTEEFLSPHRHISFGSRKLYSKADVQAILSNYHAYKITTKHNGAYVYFAYNGDSSCTDIDGCRGYLLLYHLETEPGVWKMVEGKRK